MGERRRTIVDALMDDRALVRRIETLIENPPEGIPSKDMVSWIIPVLCVEAGGPTFAVDRDLWGELLQTDPPRGPLPRLPFEAVCLCLPEDMAPMSDHGVSLPDILIVSMPEMHGVWSMVALRGDDPRTVLGTDVQMLGPETAGDAMAAIRSLFALMEDDQLALVRVPDGPKLGPSKAKVLIRRGRTRRGCTHISLTATHRAGGREVGTVVGASPRPHIRRGHWCHYWVLDPGERTSLARKGHLHKIRRWIRPCVVGRGEPKRREYEVTL